MQASELSFSQVNLPNVEFTGELTETTVISP